MTVRRLRTGEGAKDGEVGTGTAVLAVLAKGPAGRSVGSLEVDCRLRASPRDRLAVFVYGFPSFSSAQVVVSPSRDRHGLPLLLATATRSMVCRQALETSGHSMEIL